MPLFGKTRLQLELQRNLTTRRVCCAQLPNRHQLNRYLVIARSSSRMGSDLTDDDRAYMQQALNLAKRGVGYTYPNPSVGCVITSDGEVVGQGYHPKCGAPHAEIFALRAAGQRAKGGTAYVTLEPCNHYGRTPPCSLALIEAGVTRVVVGVQDPNPLVGGNGIRRLLDAGVKVDGPCLEEDCYAINSEFMERMKNA